ncbi:MAG: zinc ribbon domain-containing protein [Roseiflexaceae bacterium]
MGFLDNISKTLSQGLDRAKFEADKLQRVMRLQGELGEIQKQIDARRMECGDRAMDLYRAGQINSPTIGDLVASLDALRASLILKEEELKRAQGENFIEPSPSVPSASYTQQVPISVETPRPAAPPPSAPPAAAPTATPGATAKSCPNCQFQMPATAIFCPNCGTRVPA